jgi:hypothetical protein
LLVGVTPEHGEVVKVGITNRPKERLRANQRADSIAWGIARQVLCCDGRTAQVGESKLISMLGTPFMGKERFAIGHHEAVSIFDAVVA